MDTLRWLTVREIAEQLRVNRRTVVSWIMSGELPAIHVGPAKSPYRLWRVSARDLDTFQRRRTFA